MNIYHYHPETGDYLAPGLADESPLEPGVWLIPAYATDIKPPRITSGKRAIFNDGAWALESIPIPEPMPEPQPIPSPSELTTEEKLASIGLTIEELRAIFSTNEVQP